MRRLGMLALFLPLSLAACAREPGPEASYRSLVRAVAARDADKAWSLLSRDSQRRLDALAREASARAPGVVPPSGKALLIGDAALAARALARVEVESESGDRAVLRVEVEGGPASRVTMVREGRAWRVEIPALPPPEKP